MSKDKEIRALKAEIENLKKENHCLNYVINRLPVSIYWKDIQGKYLGCNQYVTQMAGVSSINDLIGKTDAQLPWSKYAKQFEKIDSRIITEGISEEIEETATLNDRKKHYFLTTKGPLCDETNKIIGVLGVSVDITERVKTQKELVVAKEKAEVANKAKEEFLYNMRHDLRTPFSGITGMATLLKSMEENEEKLQYINNICISSEELLDHLNTILEFIQSDSGSIPVIKSQLDLKELIQSCINMFMPTIELKKIRLFMDYANNLSSEYLSDDFRLKRILMNLLGNAVKFTDENGQIYISIKILTEDNEKKTALVQIQVEDNGIGIPIDKQEVIFEKFERLSSSYKGKYKGSGLGLHSVKTLVTDLDGEIFVESKPNEGAKFICNIPMGIADVLINDNLYQHHQENLLSQSLDISPDILLVEDSPIVQLSTTAILEQLNCFVDVVDSGEKAVNYSLDKSYDIIFMDIGLPGIDGFEAARQIREDGQNKLTPIIALTAHAAHEIDEKCQLVKINESISKPLTQDKAINILNNFTDQKNMPERIDDKKSVYSNNDQINVDKNIIDLKDSLCKRGYFEDVKKYCFLLKDNLIVSLEKFTYLIRERDFESLAKEVHKLKGALSLVSLPQLQKTIEDFDIQIKKKNYNNIDYFIGSIEIDAQKFFSELDKF